jgi:BirA family biotin operon repressor/biotin-[acetyl-CoA-carboxylase] ligase
MEDLKFNVLKALAGEKGFVSGAKLASLFGVSRTAIWKSISSLRAMGYVIEGAPKAGYRFVKAPDLLLPYEIRRGLETRTLGRRIEYYEEVGSTNDIARELASKGAPEGTLVIAERQTKGRGRLGREWLSPRGGLWFSIILRPKLAPGEVARLALMLGVVVARVLNAYGLRCRLKWPNDVLVRGRKVCGILTEIDAEMDRVNYVVAGIGINVNNEVRDFPAEFRHAATTMKAELGREVARAPLLRHLLEELEEYYGRLAREDQAVLEEWRELSSTLGKRVRVVTQSRTLEGIALDIADDGALLLQLEDGRVERILSGDCLHIGKI